MNVGVSHESFKMNMSLTYSQCSIASKINITIEILEHAKMLNSTLVLSK